MTARLELNVRAFLAGARQSDIPFKELFGGCTTPLNELIISSRCTWNLFRTEFILFRAADGRSVDQQPETQAQLEMKFYGGAP